MNIDLFWELIDRAKQEANGSLEKQITILIDMLVDFELKDIIEFQALYVQKQNEAYSLLMWDVCEFITCGGGEQNFLNFRAWLISQGKNVFTKALENPDSLHEILDSTTREDASYELFSYVALRAYDVKTGKKDELPATFPHAYAGSPSGKGLSPTQSIQEVFPNLYSKLGECPDY
jgi:hypothetical protein